MKTINLENKEFYTLYGEIEKSIKNINSELREIDDSELRKFLFERIEILNQILKKFKTITN